MERDRLDRRIWFELQLLFKKQKTTWFFNYLFFLLHPGCACKCASSWVTALPLSCHGFVLHKAAFRDALCLRYGWQPQSLPSQCTCGQTYSVSHALSCPIGGYPTLRHNEVRDFTAGLLREVCHDVTTEPPLQPLTGEAFIASSVKRDDQARLGISACGFWGGRFEKAFFDVLKGF